MPEDRTDQLRKAPLKTGQVYSGEPLKRCDCRVSKRHRWGVMIELTQDLILPEEVRLISALSIDRLCKVVWQEGRKVGLKYDR
jgi:hypothetical protein